MKNNPGVPFLSRPGGKKKMLSSTCIGNKHERKVIPSVFHQRNFCTTNNCVWLSVAIAVYFANIEDGLFLLQPMKQDPEKYHNLYFWKEPGQKMMDSHNTLRKYLADSKLNWRLHRIKGVQTRELNNHILINSSEGLFVCLLCPTDCCCEHTVVIDVKKKEIYDCEENFVLELTQNNLNRCCGRNKTFLRFEMCYLIKKI